VPLQPDNPENNYLITAGGPDGIFIFDITDPTDPTQVGHFDTDGFAIGVTVSGKYAYVTDGDNGLVIIDITDPAVPTLTFDMVWFTLYGVSAF
jgi:hypothetical protein